MHFHLKHFSQTPHQICVKKKQLLHKHILTCTTVLLEHEPTTSVRCELTVCLFSRNMPQNFPFLQEFVDFSLWISKAVCWKAQNICVNWFNKLINMLKPFSVFSYLTQQNIPVFSPYFQILLKLTEWNLKMQVRLKANGRFWKKIFRFGLYRKGMKTLNLHPLKFQFHAHNKKEKSLLCCYIHLGDFLWILYRSVQACLCLDISPFQGRDIRPGPFPPIATGGYTQEVTS